MSSKHKRVKLSPGDTSSVDEGSMEYTVSEKVPFPRKLKRSSTRPKHKIGIVSHSKRHSTECASRANPFILFEPPPPSKGKGEKCVPEKQTRKNLWAL